MLMHYGYFNGQIMPTNQIGVGVTDLGLLRGYGLFDYLRTYNGRPFQWDLYWARLQNSAREMHLPLPMNERETYATVLDLISRSRTGSEDVAIRFVVTGGYSPDSITIDEPNFMILIEEVRPAPESQFEQGIRIILDEYVRDMAEVKSTDYKRVILKAGEIKAAGASDLLYHKNGEISELSRSNFFLIRGEKLITPNRHILHGVTRRTLMDLAQTDFQVEERPVLLSELYEADEAFTTSTLKMALPIVQIGELTIGDGKPGPKTTLLRERFKVFAKKN
jgi:branched-chain amino acid aminotransferase